MPGADWLAHHDVGSATGLLSKARDSARGRLLTLGAGLLAAGALLFTARNFNLSREGRVTDRYTKAIEQLGSKELDVRIGGIYALERIARDSAKDHPAVMEVLAAFIREHSREQWPPPDPDNPDQLRLTRPDVQAAATVAGRRNAKRDIRPIDLTRADLTRTDLTGAHLAGARLDGADLTGVHLTGARLNDADLTGARLNDADLTRARLNDADLTRARLTGTDLTGARLDGADLTGARLTGARLNDARWPEGVQVPGGWMVGSDSGRLKRSVRLSGRSVSVSMPQLGESVTEGTVARWLKNEGDLVEVDEPLLEVSTDKVDTEIPSPATGILRSIAVDEDETVAVGSQLAVIQEVLS